MQISHKILALYSDSKPGTKGLGYLKDNLFSVTEYVTVKITEI